MTAKPRQLTIHLAVADLSTSAAFYGGILELPLEHALTAPGAPDHFTINHEGAALVFVEQEAMIREHPRMQDRMTLFPKGIGMSLHFRVTDIEDIADALDEEGLEVLYPLTQHPFGVKEIWCFDPDGYLVVVEEPVKK